MSSGKNLFSPRGHRSGPLFVCKWEGGGFAPLSTGVCAREEREISKRVLEICVGFQLLSQSSPLSWELWLAGMSRHSLTTFLTPLLSVSHVEVSQPVMTWLKKERKVASKLSMCSPPQQRRKLKSVLSRYRHIRCKPLHNGNSAGLDSPDCAEY